jgi:thioredoxin-related protein
MVRFHVREEPNALAQWHSFQSPRKHTDQRGTSLRGTSHGSIVLLTHLRTMRTLLACIAVLLVSCSSLSSAEGWNTDLSRTLSKAKTENKMAFILLGRENCGNCQATKKLVNSGAVPVTQDKFVIAEINTDDPVADEEFLKKFGRDNFGDTLPFVVITDSKGKVLAHYSGFKSQTELTKIVREATTKTGAAS